jgi:dTMP kinase
MRGRFVAFEGGEASGKSTQAAALADALGAVLTREPGGTAVGERIRAVLLDPATGDLDPRTEALLMAAARAEHVATVIGPALAAGRDVVCDRFSGSSVAYQGYGRGLAPGEVASLSSWASAGLEPDLVVLLDVPAEVAAARLGGEHDRLEAAGEAFHASVAVGFRAQAAAAPERWLVLDGNRPIADLAAEIASAVLDRLPRS